MIKCFLVLCVVGHTAVCQPPQEVVPTDDHMIASPLECGRGGFIAYTQSPDPMKLEWFPKVYGRQEGDGAEDITRWVAEQKAKAARLTPQVR